MDAGSSVGGTTPTAREWEAFDLWDAEEEKRLAAGGDLEPFDDSDDEEMEGVSGQLLVVSGLERARGGDCVGLPERGVDRPGCAAEEQKVTNEAKFYDDVIGPQIPENVEVVADSGGDLGIDALRTKPKFGDGQWSVVGRGQWSVVSGQLRQRKWAGAMLRGGRWLPAGIVGCGRRVAGPDQRGRKISSGAKRRARRERERRLDEMREAQRALAEEIRKLPPEGGEHVGLMCEVLAASVELGKALGGHEARSP